MNLKISFYVCYNCALFFALMINNNVNGIVILNRTEITEIISLIEIVEANYASINMTSALIKLMHHYKVF